MFTIFQWGTSGIWKAQSVRPVYALDQPHSKIHAAKFWQSKYRNLALASSTTVNLLFVTDVDEYHLDFHLVATGEMRYEMYRLTTLGAIATTGTAMSIISMNQTRESLPSMSFYSGSAVDTTTSYEQTTTHGIVPGGSGGNAVGGFGGGFSRAPEINLRTLTAYFMPVTNRSTQSESVEVGFGFYNSADY